jgi:hypothetical protein
MNARQLHAVIDPVLETANIVDLSASHRTAVSNAVCSIIEKCQASSVDYVRNELLDDTIWFRLFMIFLERSDDAKGKSIRQMLLVLTNVLLKTGAASDLSVRATSTLLDIICARQDRVKVKPALQGLAHFLLKGVVTISQLLDLYTPPSPTESRTENEQQIIQSLFRMILSWVVHHDTSLSAGHLIKNYLGHVRRRMITSSSDSHISPIWIEPVVKILHLWPDRIQEFKTHVFPHCFLPNVEEYLKFLSYLNFSRHIVSDGDSPDLMKNSVAGSNGLTSFEEFTIILASMQTGKELGIVKDIGKRYRRFEILANNAGRCSPISGS